MYAGEGHYFDLGCYAVSKEDCISDENILKYLYSPISSLQNQVVLEKSPNYFNDFRIPELIKLYNKNIKIIVITCEPAARAYSG